jgi:2-keto-4-pentenoate hydratase/2-oxohepta-3-ene-1,7-dioic acid hydratase in catechol pathway
MSWFALATSARNKSPALVHDGQLYEPEELARFGTVAAILAEWDAHSAEIRRLGESLPGKRRSAGPAKDNVAAPFRPARIFCAAANYGEHAKEMASALAAKSQSKPYMFLKLQNCVIGPNDRVMKPPETQKLDWEVELGAVIGRRARRVSAERALDYVAGYTVVNDVSARDLNSRTDYPFKHDWFQGKCHDTFAPLGPWIVPAWQIPDPQKVNLKLTVNGEVKQRDSSANMIWTVREQIAYLSTIVTLEPGDVIATGTPAGVGMAKGTFLNDGDVMEASIEEIGTLRNPVSYER